MNLAQLRAAFRVDADDLAKPYLFKDEQFLEWINEAQDEACIRANLLFESANSALCELDVGPDERSYALDDRWYTLSKAFLVQGDCALELTLTSRERLDSLHPRWRTERRSTSALMVFDTRVEFDVAPVVASTLRLEGYRVPLARMEDDEDSPEIARVHHRQLVHWALHRGYSVPDSEVFNPQKAAASLADFVVVFGLRPDADMRKAWFEDTPHRNEGFWV